jgi:hypothetical protein
MTDDEYPDEAPDLPFPEGFLSDAESWDDIPDGMRKLLQAVSQNQITARMEEEAEKHLVQRFFDELDVEGLRALGHVFHDIVAEDGSKLAAYYQGVVRSALYYKHSVCPTCGVNHEEEAMRELSEGG